MRRRERARERERGKKVERNKSSSLLDNNEKRTDSPCDHPFRRDFDGVRLRPACGSDGKVEVKKKKKRYFYELFLSKKKCRGGGEPARRSSRRRAASKKTKKTNGNSKTFRLILRELENISRYDAGKPNT